MSIPLTPADLQKPEILHGQRIERLVERVGWVVMALILTLAALGGFGGGRLAHASRSVGAVGLEYDRLVRHGVPTQLRLTIGPGLVTDGAVRIALDWQSLKAFDFQDIRPSPRSSFSSNDQLFLEFAATPGEESYIVLELKPRDMGDWVGRIEVGEGTVLEFTQIVLP
jgi:hypothetical protein